MYESVSCEYVLAWSCEYCVKLLHASMDKFILCEYDKCDYASMSSFDVMRVWLKLHASIVLTCLMRVWIYVFYASMLKVLPCEYVSYHASIEFFWSCEYCLYCVLCEYY